jgi:uncharacterized protein YbbC (DUF1343 family)
MFGIDRLLQEAPIWKKARIGLVTNEAATTRRGIPTRKALIDQGFSLTVLFSPEHGLDTRGVDGAKMDHGQDALTGLPVVSLYGDQLAPSAKDLAALDVLLFDIPDVGCRFYTYLWTLTHVLEACGRTGTPLVVLDRPNPLSGRMDLAEGPRLAPSCASFIGRWDIPLRHSCTLGELAIYFNAVRGIGATVEVIRSETWRRRKFQPEGGLPFVPTSPAIRSFASALVYPGLGLLEATNVSEGRGTDYAFQVAGAPWLTDLSLPGAIPWSFRPSESKYAGELCRGLWFPVADPGTFRSVENGFRLLHALRQVPGFSWNTYPTHINPTGGGHLDLLTGIPESESLLTEKDLPASLPALLAVPEWAGEIAPYLLYD